jgi:hypothetical protein
MVEEVEAAEEQVVVALTALMLSTPVVLELQDKVTTVVELQIQDSLLQVQEVAREVVQHWTVQ